MGHEAAGLYNRKKCIINDLQVFDCVKTVQPDMSGMK